MKTLIAKENLKLIQEKKELLKIIEEKNQEINTLKKLQKQYAKVVEEAESRIEFANKKKNEIEKKSVQYWLLIDELKVFLNNTIRLERSLDVMRDYNGFILVTRPELKFAKSYWKDDMNILRTETILQFRI